MKMSRVSTVACLAAVVAGTGSAQLGTPDSVALRPAAYALLHERVRANQLHFYIYKDADSGLNHGFPSGFFGGVDSIHIDTTCVDDPRAANGCTTDPLRFDREHGTVMRVTFDPQSSGQFAGVNIEEPENWGVSRLGTGYDLRGATRVVFDVRSPTPGGVRVQFGVAGGTTAFIQVPQSSTYRSLAFPLSALGLSDADLADAHILFAVATNDVNARAGGTVLLDNLRLEPVPFAQRRVLGLPAATETFGVVPVQAPLPGRVAIPPDQLNRNLATTYESALAVRAFLDRGSPADVADALFLAETLAHALNHENGGDPLPVGSDGSRALHNAYESGDIALHNGQGPGAGQAGEVRLGGFSATSCSPTGFCLVLDGATGGNNAFAILALTAAYQRSGNDRFLAAAETIGRWIHAVLRDGGGYGGYALGYPDEGVVPKILLRGKSVENNADIFAAFTALAITERRLGHPAQADEWTARAEAAGDFVMQMFDQSAGRFHAGTVPQGTAPAPGICPDGPARGKDVINTCDFLDANSFPILAMAAAPRYRNQIDWRRPAQFVVDTFAQTVHAAGREFSGFDIVEHVTAGPEGVAWEFTGQVVAVLRLVDRLYGETRFATRADFYLDQLREAQRSAPFGDGRGIVASTLEGGESVPVHEQCESTPFQCIPERVGLAATAWAVLAERGVNVFAPLMPTETLAFSAAHYGVTETAGTATITVRRRGAPTGTVNVSYGTFPGTATPGVDYKDVSGVLTFTPGVLSRAFTVPVISHSIPVGNRTVQLRLTNPTEGSALGRPWTALLTITSGPRPR
jgi:hypothetical protein